MLPFQAQSSLEKPQNRAFATLAVYVTVISDRRSTSLQNKIKKNSCLEETAKLRWARDNENMISQKKFLFLVIDCSYLKKNKNIYLPFVVI